MNKIYSEKEVFNGKDMIWGTWQFSLSDEQINEKIASLPKVTVSNSNEADHWKKLFSTFKIQSNSQQPVEEARYLSDNELDSSMEGSSTSTSNRPSVAENMDTDDNSLVKELSCSLLDECYRVTYDLRCGVDVVRKEMCNVSEELSTLQEHSLILVMDSVWPKLNSDASKICFCIPFTTRPRICEHLCKHILLNWLSKASKPKQFEDLSKILSSQGDVVCKYLIAPLVQIENSILVQDVMNLEDIMGSMSEINWTTLLSTLLHELKDLHKWIIPILSTIVERSRPSSDDMNLLILLMSSSGTDFSQNRDFGTLLVNAANCLINDSTLVTQLKLIATNYNLPLKYKALKVLNNIKK